MDQYVPVLYTGPWSRVAICYVISRVHCALGRLYILLTLLGFCLFVLFLYCALRSHIRFKRLTNILRHYMFTSFALWLYF